MTERSLSIRFIVTAVLAVAASFMLFIGLVYTQHQKSLKTQTQALERITAADLSAVLGADLGLAAARLRFLFSDTARRVQAIATRADTRAAVSSHNVVAIAELLGPAARNAEVDAIIVVDRDLNVIGASSDQFDLVGIDRAIKASPERQRFMDALEATAPQDEIRIVALLSAEELPAFVPGIAPHQVQQVVFEPLTDEFGEVTGALIAQRWIRSIEPTLQEFARITDVGIAVYANKRLISEAGTGFARGIDAPPTEFLNPDPQHRFIARCGPTMSRLEICALKPIEELYRAQDRLTEIGQAESLKLVRWLGIVGVGSSILLMILLALTARPITRPLRRLAETVGLIARGIYDAPVDGTERQDEVGAIARAVAALNDSVRERDELRANILVQNSVLERRESELRTQNRLFDAALNNMSHGLCMFDRDRRLIVSNRRYEEIFGFEHGDVLPGTSWDELHALERVVSETPEHDAFAGEGSEFDGPGIGRTSTNVRLHDGRTILSTRQPLVGGGWVVIYEDITERQRAREKLVHMARHDVLTGLPNRVTLREHLSRQLARQRLEGGTFAVLCLDLDEFKTVNDTFGHPAGDRLLCEVTRRLLACVDEVEMVARLGGDEFAIVTRLAPTTEMIALRSEMLIKAIGEPHLMEDHEAVIGVSIGIAVAPTDGRDPDTLLKQADLALYRSKFEGRNTYRFFETGMEEAVKARHDLITDLRSALENGELEAYFQPQVDLATGDISGFEALMRWNHPRRGMVPPVEFIPIAEETGLIIPIGEWMLREATTIAARWPSPIKVAVNISARQLQRSGFVMTVTSALAASGLPASRLELEVTESVLLQEDDHTRASLSSLKELGVKIAMDDFGTGYSSLSCLRSFPFDKIKIDQSFVRAMPTSEEARSIVSAIIGLAQNLRIATTAEGVETEDLLEILRDSGCTEGQGYHIGRPEPAAHAHALVARYAPAPRIRALN